MNTPYTHPSMPGTRYLADSIPENITDSPARPPAWITVEEALTADRIAARDIRLQARIIEDAQADAEGQELVRKIHDRKAQESA